MVKNTDKKIFMLEKILAIKLHFKHMEVGNKSKSMAGTTYDRMAVVTRVSNGKNVKYSSNVVKSTNNLRRVLKKSLRLNKRKKATRGKGKGKGKGTAKELEARELEKGTRVKWLRKVLKQR